MQTPSADLGQSLLYMYHCKVPTEGLKGLLMKGLGRSQYANIMG